MQASTSSLVEPSPLSTSADAQVQDSAANDPLDEIPPLQSYITTDPAEQTAALKLVADSVAQMRQTASRALIFHPLNIAVLVALMAVIAQYLYKVPNDIGLVFTTSAGITMAFLVSVRWATGRYLELAEAVNVGLLDGADVLITKFGDEVIGALILGWVPVESSSSSRGNKRRKGYRGEIRGWAVRLRYRHKGVGTALLEDAVDEGKKKGVENVVFAEDMPSMFSPTSFFSFLFVVAGTCDEHDHKWMLMSQFWQIRRAFCGRCIMEAWTGGSKRARRFFKRSGRRAQSPRRDDDGWNTICGWD